MLQAILHIFARQLRMMETHVDIQVAEEPIKRTKQKPFKHIAVECCPIEPETVESKEHRQRFKSKKERGKSPSLSSSGDEIKKSKRVKSSDKVEKIDQKEQEKIENNKLANMNNEERGKYFKDREKAMLAKMDVKAREKYIKEEEEESRERHKIIIANMNESDKAMFAKLDDKDRLKYLLQKDSKDKEQAKLTKMRELERGLHSKEKEKPRTRRKRDENEEYETDETDERDGGKQKAKYSKLDRKTKENYLKEKEEEIEKAMIAKMDENEKEKYNKMNKKERAKYLSEKEKEGREKKPDRDHEYEDIIAEMEDEEKNRFAKMDENGKNIYLKQKRTERKEKLPNMDDINETEEREILARMDDTEKEKFAKMDKKEKEKYLKEKGAAREEAILVKMDEKEKEKYAKMDEKDKKKYISSKAKEISEMEASYDRKEELLTKMDEKEKEKYAKMDEKDKKKYISNKAKEIREMEAKYNRQEELLAKMDGKEKAEFAKMDETGKDKYLKEKEQQRKEALLAKMDKKEQEKFSKLDDIGKVKYLEEKYREESMLATMNEREKDEYANMDEIDKGKYIKEKEKRGKKNEKDEKKGPKSDKMDEKEKEKYRKEKEREEREKPILAKKHDKKAPKLADMDEKEKKEYEREGREMSILAKMTKKEKEKFAKMDGKDKENYLNKKEREEREKTILAEMDQSERSKFAKMNEKGKEKYLIKKQREKAMLENMDAKEKMLYSKMDEKGKENYLIEKEKKETENKIAAKEKTRYAKDARTRVGSIEVVTVSEFDLLKAEVKELQAKSAPIPFPTMPDNKKLMIDIASGSASLTDTMQAMQLSARVEAAETTISQMAGILTALASGTIPGNLADMEDAMGAPGEGRGAFRENWFNKRAPSESRIGWDGGIMAGPAAGQPSDPPPAKVKDPVSQKQFDNALRGIRDDLKNSAITIATQTQKIAESAHFTANHVADKLDGLSELKPRMEEIQGLINDYASQLAGFDTGVASQMENLNEQIRHMRFDMDEGLNQLLSATVGNSETEAVKDLHVRFDDLVLSLEVTLHMHTELNSIHNQLKQEMMGVLGCLEALRDEKMDRDEVLDALQDKADMLRLDGLLTEKNFKVVHEYLENKLSLNHENLVKQDNMWMKTLSDLSVNVSLKSNLIQVEILKKDTEEQFKKLQQDLILLAKALGDPKAALLTRQLSVGAICGPCRLPALQETTEVNSGQPPSLPPLRRVKPEVKPEPCLTLVKRPQSPQGVSAHVCHRWAGGSHTLVSESVVRRQAAPLTQAGGGAPTKPIAAPGADGRMYMMEGLLDVCMQCNKVQNPIDLRMDGTGDSVKKSNLLLNNNKDQ